MKCINLKGKKFYKCLVSSIFMENIEISFPVVVMKEGNWFVASCPPLDIATQGETEQEVKENMADLIEDYLEDEDTPKPKAHELQMTSLSYIVTKVPKRRFIQWENSSQLPQQE